MLNLLGEAREPLIFCGFLKSSRCEIKARRVRSKRFQRGINFSNFMAFYVECGGFYKYKIYLQFEREIRFDFIDGVKIGMVSSFRRKCFRF